MFWHLRFQFFSTHGVWCKSTRWWLFSWLLDRAGARTFRPNEKRKKERKKEKKKKKKRKKREGEKHNPNKVRVHLDQSPYVPSR